MKLSIDWVTRLLRLERMLLRLEGRASAMPDWVGDEYGEGRGGGED